MRFPLTAALLSIAAMASQAQAQQYSVVFLDPTVITPPSGYTLDWSTANKVSDTGWVTGTIQFRRSGFPDIQHMFRWNPNTNVMTDLGALTAPFSLRYDAQGINDSGTVVGEARNDDGQDSSPSRWVTAAAGNPVSMVAGTLGFDPDDGQGAAIDNNGYMFGMRFIGGARDNSFTFARTVANVAGVETNLGAVYFPGGEPNGPNGVCLSGNYLCGEAVVSPFSNDKADGRAWIANLTGGLPGTRGPLITAVSPYEGTRSNAVNGSGHLAGTMRDDTFDDQEAPFFFDGTTTTVVPIFPGQVGGEPGGLNDSDVMVGRFWITQNNGPDVPFIWTLAGGVKNFTTDNTLPSGWTLESANGINNSGMIAGSAGFSSGGPFVDGPVLLVPVPTITLSAIDATGAETGQDPVTFRVTRTGPTILALDVYYTLDPSSTPTVNNNDIVSFAGLGTATIPAGQSFVDVTITPVDDQVVEGTETAVLAVDLQSHGGGGGAVTTYVAGVPNTVTLTITDNDTATTAGLLAFSSSGYQVNENVVGGTVTLTVNRSGGTSGPVSCTWTVNTSQSTAQVSDLTGPLTGTLSWLGGVGGAKTFTIGINDDGQNEGTEDFNVDLSLPTGGAFLGGVGAFDSAQVDIFDDESRVDIIGTNPSVAENVVGGLVSITLHRTGGVANSSVTFTTSDNVATAPADYTAVNQVVSWIGTDYADKVVTIPIIDDALAEADEVFNVGIGSQVNCSIGQSFGQVTILDDEASVGFAYFGNTLSETQGGGNVQVNRRGSSAGSVSVDYAFNDGSGTRPTDYTVSGPTSGTLTWAAGDTAPKSLQFNVVNTPGMQSDRTFTVSLSTPVSTVIGGPSVNTVTITDTDSQFEMNAATLTVNENSGGYGVQVNRLGGTANSADLTFTVTAGTATSGGDYTLQTSSPLHWDDYDFQRNKFINFQPTNDSTAEADETYTVTLNSVSGSGASLKPAGVMTTTVTIHDDDAYFIFGVSNPSVIETAGGTNASIGVSRVGNLSLPATVTVRTADNTAFSGLDYTGGDYVVNFLATENFKIINIPILDDVTLEGDELVDLTLVNGTAGYSINGSAQLTIQDNEVRFLFNPATFTVNENAGSINIDMLRQGATWGTVSFTFDTVASSTATAGSDFTAIAGQTVTFLPGETLKTVAVTIANDGLAESDEQFSVQMSAYSVPGLQNQLTANPNGTIVTIVDNDAAVTFSSATYNGNEGTTIATTVSRLGSLTGTVSAQLTVSGASTAVSGTDYTAITSPQTLTWGPGDSSTRTINVVAAQNVAVAADKTVILNLASVTSSLGGTGSATPTASTTVTINDDDGGFTFSAVNTSAAENIGAATTITVLRNGSTVIPESVDYATNDGTATGGGTDFFFSGGTLNFASGETFKTFDVFFNDDALAEADETIVLTLSNPTGGMTIGGPATITILDNDTNTAPTLTAILDPAAILEDAGAQVVNLAGITMGGTDTGQILSVTATSNNTGLIPNPTVTYTSPNGTGSLGYTPVANANGSAIITVTVTDDGGTVGGGVDTFQRTFTVNVTAVNDAPTFTKGADQTKLEDSGLTTVAGWATVFNPGPANESGQTALAFVVSNDNNGLFSTQPAVSAAGALTYTLAADANGSATVTVQAHDNGGTANSGVDLSAAQTFTITVTSVNDVPAFTKGGDQTVLEDAGAQTVLGWATSISKGPVNEAGQTVSFNITANTNAGLFSSGPAVNAAGDLSYTPAVNANGSATVTLDIQDNGGTGNGGVDTSATQTFVINVTGVNDAPTFTKGADQTKLEDSGTTTIAGWATAFNPGPANESAQTLLGYVVSNTNNGLFSTQPAVSAAGVLTFTLAADANGAATVSVQAQDNGGTANAGVDLSAVQTFTITVTAVNDVPAFTKGGDQTVLEDAGAQTVLGWATSISKGPVNEAGQTVSFNITANTNAGLFSSGPAVNAAGDLSYTPAVNANGSATVTLDIQDSGGTANGGVDTSATQTFVINVTGVNDAPTFTKGADQTVLEDSGTTTVAGWATAFNPGPANESAQTLLGYVVSNTNNGLFSTQPSVSVAGVLTFTLAADANGAATVSVQAQDNGGTANAGVDLSAVQTFTITVTAVNDVPAFTKGGDQTVLEDAVAQTVLGWATSISKGPGNEAGQTVSFNITANTNAGLFSSGPAVNAAGDLSYTPALNANGSATVTLDIQDNGGTANGGVDTSATQTFTITVTGINDVPSFTKGADQALLEDAGAQTVVGWATALSKGPANESAQVLNFIVTNTNNALFSSQPAVAANGTLTYTTSANANGAATVSVQIHDDGGTANGGVDTSAIQTFTVTVTAVNDAPTFTKGADQAVNEDAAAQTIAGWATAFSPGPADEAAQTVLAYIVSNTNNPLFSVQPAVAVNGTLTYTLVANASGAATVTVQVRDNGGTANGGSDTSAAQTFTITVGSVNDAPTISPIANPLAILEDAAAQTVNFAGVSVGTAANEVGQVITVTATSSDTSKVPNPTVTYVSPGATGSLSYTPVANANGSVVITVTVKDDGGIANGGIDTVTTTFTVAITAVNDAPVAIDGSAAVVQDVPATATVSATDVDGDPLTFTILTGPTHGTLSALSGTTTTYTPNGGYTGPDSFTYKANDGTLDSNVATISITVTATGSTVGGNFFKASGGGCGLGGGSSLLGLLLALAFARKLAFRKP